jgi:hypothetical protein
LVPSETQKDTTNSIRAIHVGALARVTATGQRTGKENNCILGMSSLKEEGDRAMGEESLQGRKARPAADVTSIARSL